MVAYLFSCHSRTCVWHPGRSTQEPLQGPSDNHHLYDVKHVLLRWIAVQNRIHLNSCTIKPHHQSSKHQQNTNLHHIIYFLITKFVSFFAFCNPTRSSLNLGSKTNRFFATGFLGSGYSQQVALQHAKHEDLAKVHPMYNGGIRGNNGCKELK